MRIGSSIVLLVVIFIGFGYLFSDNMHTREDLAEADQQIARLLNENKSIQAQLDEANLKNISLNVQVDQLLRQIIVQDTNIKQFQEDIRLIKDQKAQLQEQLDQIIRLNPLIENLLEFIPQSLSLALLIPILPASLAATFVIYRYKQHRIAMRSNQSAKSNRTVTVQLTEKEMKEIIRIRRTR
jgi:chromosome segregation ATPase